MDRIGGSDVSSGFPVYFFSKATSLEEPGRADILLMLDFDGTLVPIMNNPADCYLSNEVRYLLSALSKRESLTTCVISGRSLADVRKRVGIRGIYYGGSHGLEVSGPAMKFVHPEAENAARTMRLLKTSVRKEFGSMPGILVESKPFSLTLHYRMLAKKNVRSTLKQFRRLISDLSSKEQISVLTGKKVLEVMPHMNWDKGAAVSLIRGRVGTQLLPVYVGDDRTDETAFKELMYQGITVRVGRNRNTLASYYLRNQKEIVLFLKYVLSLDSTEGHH